MDKLQDELIHILIVDDEPTERNAINKNIHDHLRDEVVVERVDSGAKAIEWTRKWHPDIVLMDHLMPGMNGIEATRHIREEDKRVGIIFLTKYADQDDLILAALRAGARGFLAKGSHPNEVAHAIRAVHSGEAMFSPGVAQRILNIFTGNRPVEFATLFPKLTPRERETLALIAQGLSTIDIATQLGITSKTVGHYRDNIYAKLEVHDQVQLILKIQREVGQHPRICPACGAKF